MKQRLITILCLLLVASAFLTACNKKEGGEQNADTTTQAQGTYQDLVPAKDIDRDITILTDFAPSMDIHEPSGDPMWDTEVNMYLLAEQKYNVSIQCKAPTNGRAFATLEMLRESDAHEFDLLYSPHPTYGIYSLITNGTMVDLHGVESLDLDGDWYSTSQVENHTANGKLFLCVPDFTIEGQGLGSYVYNTSYYAALGFEEDLYQVAKDGNWTIEKLLSIVQEAATGSEGTDQSYALCFWKNQIGGLNPLNILVKNEDDRYELGLNANKLSTVIDQTMVLLNEESVLISESYNAGFADTDIWKAFSAGRGLFLTAEIGQSDVSQHLRTLDFDINYLPAPKASANDDYHASTASGFCGIPTIAYDKEESGLLMECMAVYGYEKLKPTFFDKILEGRLAKEAEDFEMLDFLHSIKTFDFGFTFDDDNKLRTMMHNIIFSETGLGGKQAISAYLKANETYIQNLVDKANAIGKD
ncbi:MAG: hypothetical protein IKC59_04630 [Clostridia bacterium]|nr:hypothetical protein [Clostridia bacterium]